MGMHCRDRIWICDSDVSNIPFRETESVAGLVVELSEHAGFYRHYARTYWKWLLVNPVELSYSAGWPVAILAFIVCWRLCREMRVESDR